MSKVPSLLAMTSQVSGFIDGWWWVRVLPPPGTLIWRFPGLIRPRCTAGATHHEQRSYVRFGEHLVSSDDSGNLNKWEYTPVIFHQTPPAYRMVKVVRAEPIVDAASRTQFWACSNRWIPRKGLGDASSRHGTYGLGSRQASGARGILACHGCARVHVRLCWVGRSAYVGLPSRLR